ncbi:uncharacterized protein LOC106865634 [Brachypodium distachyon]|uniref:uncharacterized protein LOC106865634 n=1 Tax=Brachypodium distachyon TaxID=15368 RepID=UPI000D0CE95D|nr:uncharacterized protein LOC106865634 [Brachypodium distachyon]|eukprot:XP_024313358.1 uncharacterized protein LOC106865634 [Brachypodium distachyon]
MALAVWKRTIRAAARAGQQSGGEGGGGAQQDGGPQQNGGPWGAAAAARNRTVAHGERGAAAARGGSGIQRGAVVEARPRAGTEAPRQPVPEPLGHAMLKGKQGGDTETPGSHEPKGIFLFEKIFGNCKLPTFY